MKTKVLTLAVALALLAGAAVEREPTQVPDTAANGADPALGCVTDSECRGSLRLVGWPHDGPRAIASIDRLSANNGGRRFAGDRRLLTTISPNGDRSRERAGIRFRLT